MRALQPQRTGDGDQRPIGHQRAVDLGAWIDRSTHRLQAIDRDCVDGRPVDQPGAAWIVAAEQDVLRRPSCRGSGRDPGG